MRNLKYIVAAAAIGSLMALPQTSSANPLASGLGSMSTNTPALADGLVQKVHGWHCRKRKGWFKGHRVWHRHRKACYDDYSHYDDDYHYRPYHYGYHAYPYYPAPFFSFSFGKRRHHGHWDDD
jgi:X-X-X-Leu-X-X-Gly heptad repeat protein